jgi:hypothetical protein
MIKLYKLLITKDKNMISSHTSYIKEMADKTGKTYRELQALWTKIEQEVEYDRMFDPNKYSHLSSLNGTISQEVQRRFEEKTINPEQVDAKETEDIQTEVEEDIIANEIEDEIEDDIETEETLDELFDEDTEDVESPEISMDDFEDEESDASEDDIEKEEPTESDSEDTE